MGLMTVDAELGLDAEDDEALVEEFLHPGRPGVVHIAGGDLDDLRRIDVVVEQNAGLDIGVVALIRESQSFTDLIGRGGHIV